MNFIALDFETTGTDAFKNGPVSLGVHNEDISGYWVMNPGSVAYDAIAMRVNGFTYEEVQGAEDVISVDLEAYEMLEPLKGENGPFVAVGFNVGSFDLQFLNRWMPNTASLFHYRSFDLNTMFMTLNPADYRGEKDLWYENALDALDLDKDDLHDALVDAEVAWNMFSSYMESQVGDEDVEMVASAQS